ncbi:MFS transporter [Streptomyces sp. NPDC056296]|uniref:MFS transporter n=1 Tax=Streptomyces sp. NPDC056296 TaxID=3345775 RepID=UPI0035D83CD4
MTLLDTSSVNVALPSVQNGLHLSAGDVSWVVAGYALAFGLALTPAGRLGDDFGRKRMFQVGLTLFVATSAFTGAATNTTWLVLGRVLMGLAAGMLNPQVMGIIQQLFTGPERNRAFGLYGATVGLSTAVGPLLGGLLLQWADGAGGWRWIFWVNVPVGIGALVAAAVLLPGERPHEVRRTPDLVGMLLLGLGVTATLLPLVQAGKTGTPQWWLLIVAIVALPAFVLWERRRSDRGRAVLVNLDLLRVRSFASGTVLATVYFAGSTGIPLVLALFFQQGLGYTPLQAGLGVLPFATGLALAPIIGSRLLNRAGRGLVVAGMVMVAVGIGVTALLASPQGSGAASLIAPLFLAGCGSGLVISPNQTLTLRDVPSADAGGASALLQTGQRIGSSIGMALTGALFAGALSQSPGEFHAAAARGLLGVVGLVVLALLLAVGDLLVPVNGRRNRA